MKNVFDYIKLSSSPNDWMEWHQALVVAEYNIHLHLTPFPNPKEKERKQIKMFPKPDCHNIDCIHCNHKPILRWYWFYCNYKPLPDHLMLQQALGFLDRLPPCSLIISLVHRWYIKSISGCIHLHWRFPSSNSLVFPSQHRMVLKRRYQ